MTMQNFKLEQHLFEIETHFNITNVLAVTE